MNEFHLKQDSQPDLRFTGKLIAESNFDLVLADKADRHFELRTYAVEGSGFVAELRYITTSDEEKDLVWYEDIDQLKDVENFYYVFDANEVIKNFDRLSRVDRELAGSTCKYIMKAYEESLYPFLDALRLTCEQQNLADRQHERPKPSILRTLGLKK